MHCLLASRSYQIYGRPPDLVRLPGYCVFHLRCLGNEPKTITPGQSVKLVQTFSLLDQTGRPRAAKLQSASVNKLAYESQHLSVSTANRRKYICAITTLYIHTLDMKVSPTCASGICIWGWTWPAKVAVGLPPRLASRRLQQCTRRCMIVAAISFFSERALDSAIERSSRQFTSAACTSVIKALVQETHRFHSFRAPCDDNA
jgi:hypothetical protein